MLYDPKQIVLTYFGFGCHVTIVEMQRVLVLALARCDRGGKVADGDVKSDVEKIVPNPDGRGWYIEEFRVNYGKQPNNQLVDEMRSTGACQNLTRGCPPLVCFVSWGPHSISNHCITRVGAGKSGIGEGERK